MKCSRLLLVENHKTTRRWERDYYCLICFENDSKIQIEILKRKQLIMDYCIDSNQVQCALCKIIVIDIQRKSMVVKCEMDHKRIFDKLFSIGDYIFTNDPRISAETVLEECVKCRVLCICCHAIVTRLETSTGMIALKTLITKRLKRKAVQGDFNMDLSEQTVESLYKMMEELEKREFQLLKESKMLGKTAFT